MSRPVDPRLLRRAPTARRLVRSLVVLQLISGMLVIAQALLLADVVVAVFTGHGLSSVLIRLLWLASVGVLRAAVSGTQEWVTSRASVRVRAELRRAGLQAIVRLGPAWAERQQPGRLVTAVGPGLDALDGYVTRALPSLVSGAVVPPLALATILVVDWQSGVILLVLLPLVPLFMILIGITTNRLVHRRYVALARLAGQFLDLLRGLTTLRIYGQAQVQERSLQNATEQYRVQTVATLRIAFLSGLVLDLIAALSVAVVAVDMGLRLDAGHVSFGVGLLVLLLAPEVFAPLRAVGAQHHASQEGGAAAVAVLDLIDESVRAPADVGSTALPPPTGRVVLDTVSMTYPARTSRALVEVSAVFEPARVTTLTGPSGAGKSTVLALLLGYVRPDVGTVSIGVPGQGSGTVLLDSVDADAWRRSIAWMPQRPRPSQATIAAEVLLGDVTATEADVADACLTCRTPDPSVPLGEDGRSLSAGERRRVALARVLLRARAVRRDGGVPIVLLDEPTEDLDRDTALVVAAVIGDLAGWATVVVATHDTRLVALAGCSIEVADGRIVDVLEQVPRRVLEPPHLEPASPRRAHNGAAPRNDRFGLVDLVRGSTRRLLGLATGLSALAALTGLGLTTSSLWLISRAAQHPNVQALAIAVVGVRTFAIGRAVVRYLERLVSHDAALHMLTSLRVDVFAALGRLSPSVLGGYGRGDLLRRFVGDVDGAQEGLVRALVPSAGAAVGGLGAVTLAAVLAPAAGAALAVGLLLAGVLVPFLGLRASGHATASVGLAGNRDRASAGLVDALGEVVAYGAATRVIDDVAAVDSALEHESRRTFRAAAGSTFAGAAIAAVTSAVVLACAARAVSTGALSVVQVGVLAGCVIAGFDAVATLPGAFVAWARCRAGLERVSEVTGLTSVLPDPASPADLPMGVPGLRGTGLDLAPDADAAHVLDGAHLTVPPGSRVAITGPSGSGKTTVLAAALRLLPLSGGSLRITGDGRSVALPDLRAVDLPPVVAGSLQGDHVFDSTLRDNLRVVRPDVSDAALDLLALRVGLLDMVRALPAGWSTPAGPDGAMLSGGQRQRLLIARALLANPEILVFDEPTAHLDAGTERLVLADLLAATDDRTVLMTTHRDIDRAYGVDGVRLSGRALEGVPGASTSAHRAATRPEQDVLL